MWCIRGLGCRKDHTSGLTDDSSRRHAHPDGEAPDDAGGPKQLQLGRRWRQPWQRK